MSMAEDNVYVGGSLSAFPTGLRVLAVDDDLNSLSFLARLLQACQYQVTTCRRGADALSLLRQIESKFDLVISDIYMPDMDGFELLEIIQLETDVPVVLLSNKDSKDVIMKAIIMGACDYLIKPVRKEEISIIWQHVVRKHKNESKSFMLSEVNPSGEEYRNKSSPEEENCGSSNHVKSDEDDGSKSDIVSLKKQRMVWTTELHEQFVAAVNEIGLKNAVPKKILELMKVPGLTRENVASHLQKYRIYLRRKTENIGKKFYNPSAQIQNVMHPCMVGSSTSHAYAMSNQFHSGSSVVSQAELEPGRLGVVAGGLPITQGNYYNQQWVYGLQASLPPPHGTPPTPTAVEPEQDEFIAMQREQPSNGNGTMHFSLPIPSLMVDATHNDQGYNLSSYDCSPDGTADHNASFATIGNSQSEYTFSGYDTVSYDSVFLVQHYNQEDLTES